MHDLSTLTTIMWAMWLTLAILAGGLARTRNRSPWFWFLITAFIGPLGAFLLVVWPALPARVEAESTTRG